MGPICRETGIENFMLLVNRGIPQEQQATLRAKFVLLGRDTSTSCATKRIGIRHVPPEELGGAQELPTIYPQNLSGDMSSARATKEGDCLADIFGLDKGANQAFC